MAKNDVGFRLLPRPSYRKIEVDPHLVIYFDNMNIGNRSIYCPNHPRFFLSLEETVARQIYYCNLINNQLETSPILLSCNYKNYFIYDNNQLPCLIAHRNCNKKINAWRVIKENEIENICKDYKDFIEIDKNFLNKYGLNADADNELFFSPVTTKDHFKHCCLFVDVNKLDLPLPSWLVKSVCENHALIKIAADWLDDLCHPTAELFRDYPDVGAMFCRKLNGENIKILRSQYI